MAVIKGFEYYYEWLKDPKNKAVSRLAVIFTAGILLLFLSKFINNAAPVSQELNPTKPQTTQESTSDNKLRPYVERLEEQLSRVLGQVQGINNVSVIITLDEEEPVEPAFNVISNQKTSEEKDSDGGVRTITEIQSTQQAIILKKGNDDAAMILKKSTPKVKGVLIVAEGANSSKMKEMIIKATATLLDIPVYKVSLLSK